MKDESNIVYGLHAVMSELLERPDQVEKLYVREGLSAPQLSQMYAICKANRIPISIVPNDNKLSDIAGSKVNHQGIIALIRDFKYVELDSLFVSDSTPPPEKKGRVEVNLIIVMDEIEDTHNVGAIIRSAVAVGARAIIIPKHRQAAINGAVYKTSAGTVNKIDIVRVSNIGVAIERLKKEGYWVGALAATPSVFWNLDLKGNIAIIVGNEGKGVSKHNIENSDFIISIPMNNKVESLNASVSAAIAMYEWKRQNSVPQC